MTNIYLSATEENMTSILSIKDRQCSIVNQQEFDDFVKNATSSLIDAMSEAYELLPFNYIELAKSYAEKLFTRDNLCMAINPEVQIKDAEDSKKLRIKFLGEKATPEEAKKYGVTAYRLKIKTTDTCPVDYKDNSQFTGNPTCKNVKDSIDGRQLPIVMYPSPLPADMTHTSIGKPGNGKYFISSSTEIDVCEKGRKKAIHYKFPVWGLFNIEYIIGTKSGVNYDTWYSFNNCFSGGKKYENDLLFNMGAHVFIDIPVEIDGKFQNRSLTLATVATSHPNSIVRAIVGEDNPYFGFIANQLAKMGFLNFLKHCLKNSPKN